MTKINFSESSIKAMIREELAKEGKEVKEFYRIEAGGLMGGRHPTQHLFIYVEADVIDLDGEEENGSASNTH
ncbi:hypothetical protein H6F61_26435 [Cyanobacteria bacterium FACHB-472]|nr:hypothetical protein [Cyanobacteria bacterium FACHB-472]